MRMYVKLINSSGEDAVYRYFCEPLCSVEWNHLCNYTRGHYGETFL